MPLTPKQATFVREYLVDLNGTQAAIRAGYSPRTANEQAAQLLAKLSVRGAIEKAQSERFARLDLTADEVVRSFRELHLRALADGDLATAARCLENLGKYLGLFERHQKQKRQYTEADAARLQAELEAAGMDFTCRNYPVELMDDAERAEQRAALERKKAEAEKRLAELDKTDHRLDLMKPGTN